MNRREFIFSSLAAGVTAAFGTTFPGASEFEKCKSDIVYFAERHLKGPDGTNVVLEDWEKRCLRRLAGGNDALLKTRRRAGKTTVCIAYAVWKSVFRGEKVCIIEPNGLMAVDAERRLMELATGLPADIVKESGSVSLCRNSVFSKDQFLKKGNLWLRNCRSFMFDEFSFFSHETNVSIMLVSILEQVGNSSDIQLAYTGTPVSGHDAFNYFCNAWQDEKGYFKVI